MSVTGYSKRAYYPNFAFRLACDMSKPLETRDFWIEIIDKEGGVDNITLPVLSMKDRESLWALFSSDTTDEELRAIDAVINHDVFRE